MGEYLAAESMTFLVYMGVAFLFAKYLRQRHVQTLQNIFLLLSAVFFLCGTTHLIGALTFFWPIYWFDAHVRLLSAIVGCIAVGVLIVALPRIMSFPNSRVAERANMQLREEVAKLTLAIAAKEGQGTASTSAVGASLAVEMALGSLRRLRESLEV